MNVNQLIFLSTAIRSGSIRAAARSMQTTEPTVVRHLNALEEEIGFRLLQRSPTGVRATTEAQALLPDVDVILKAVERLTAKADDLRRTVPPVRVGVIPSMAAWLVSDVLPHYRLVAGEAHTAILEAGSLTILNAMRNGEVDLGIIVWADAIGLPDHPFRCESVFDVRVMVVVGSASRFHTRSSGVYLEELAGEPVIIYPDGYLVYEAFRRGILPRRREQEIKYVNNGRAASEIIRTGGAIAYTISLPTGMAAPESGVVLLPILDFDRSVHVSLVYEESRRVRGLVRAVRRAAQEAMTR